VDDNRRQKLQQGCDSGDDNDNDGGGGGEEDKGIDTQTTIN
jgi:hypothetical protein